MPTPAPPKPLALALSTHPGPTLAVTVVTAVLAAGLGLEPWRIVVLSAAMLVGQASVGLSNDWIDAARDVAVGRRDKPVARGWVGAELVRRASIVTAVLAVLLTIPLGWAATVAHAVFIASAWSYNVWLKRTVFSVAPFVVSFGLLPAIVTLSAPQPTGAAGWALGAGALLGVAAHFSNVLPDLADDRATGIAGLPHRLGRAASGAIIAAALAAASVFVVFGDSVADGGLYGGGESPGTLQYAGLTITLLLAAACATLAVSRPPTRLLFQIIIAATLVDVVLLAAAGTAVVA
jgi:4-hydroxybenzoate polyprenyltransferase